MPVRLRDPVRGRRREPGSRAPVDVVADDSDVVRCRAPGERDLAEAARRRQCSRRARKRRVGSADRRAHVGRDLCRAERAAVDPHLVDEAAEPLRPDRVSADPQGRGRGHDGTGDRDLRDLRAVHEQPLGRPVERRREVRPEAGRDGGCAVKQTCGWVHRHLRLRPVGVAVRVEAVDEVAGALLDDQRSEAAAAGRGVDPALDRHAGGDVERVRVRDVDHRVRPVERESVTELAERRPGRVRERPRVAVPRTIGGRGPAALVEAPRGDQSRRRSRPGRNRASRLVRGGADVSGRVLSGHPVVVGAGGEAGVREARRGRLPDPIRRRGSESRRRAPVDVVPADPGVVGRGVPGQRNLSRAAVCDEVGRRARRRGVSSGRDPNDGRDRGHAVRVHEEQHVVAGRREVRVCGCLHGHLAAAGREVEELEALVLVERVRDRRQSDQGDLRDLRGIRRVDVEARPVRRGRRRRRDRRPGSLEEIRRRVDLGVFLVDRKRARQLSPAGHQDAAVRQQQRRRVVEAAVLERIDRRPRLRVRVPDLGRQNRVHDVAAVRPASAAACEHRPVGKQREVVVRAAERHRGRLPPRGRGRAHVDHGGSPVGRVRPLVHEIRIRPRS